MTASLTIAQLTGRDEGHLVELPCGNRMLQDAARAFASLQEDAREAGFDLAIASAYRSFERQLAIFNGKASGQRVVHDDRGEPIAMDKLPALQQLRAILRFSALPGTSRHHWGTDLDIFDAAAAGGDYCVQLSPAEVAPGGVFDGLHCWLDQRIAAGQSHGFFRPYALDRGGVATERWHLSYAPLARDCGELLTESVMRESWTGSGLLLRDEIEENLADILARYVAVPRDWCPSL